MTHPITPPPELADQWVAEACPECRLTYDEFTGESVEILVARAAQWGADQELEACCEWIYKLMDRGLEWSMDLRAARRPKPPSLKKQALEALRHAPGPDSPNPITLLTADEHALIRRALEALDD